MSKTLRAALRCVSAGLSIGVLARTRGSRRRRTRPLQWSASRRSSSPAHVRRRRSTRFPARSTWSPRRKSRAHSAHPGRHRRARTHGARLLRIVAGSEQPRRDAARPRAAATVRRHSSSTPLRDGSRNSVFTDMDVVGRIEVINGPSAAEGIGAAGGIINYISKDADRARVEVQRLHEPVPRSSRTTATVGRLAAPSRTSRTTTTWYSTASLGRSRHHL